MNTIEQAREVSKRLSIGATIARERRIDHDFAVLADHASSAIAAQPVPTWTDADIAKMHRLAAALDSDEPSIAGFPIKLDPNMEPDQMKIVAAPVQAGAQPAPKQEPVGVFRLYEGSYDHMAESYCHDDAVLLYAAPVEPQERKPLTDDQITEVWRELRAQKEDWSDLDFARAIEAKIKEQP